MSESNTPAKRTRSKSTTDKSPSSRTRSAKAYPSQKEQENEAAAPPQKKKRASSSISIAPSTKFVQDDESEGTEEPLTQPLNEIVNIDAEDKRDTSEEREEKMGSSSINVTAASSVEEANSTSQLFADSSEDSNNNSDESKIATEKSVLQTSPSSPSRSVFSETDIIQLTCK